jgi:acetyl esterase/lipase
MNISRIILLLLLLSTQLLHAQKDSVYIWPNAVPGETKPKSAPVITVIEDGSTRTTEMSNPYFAIFQPKAGMKNHKAIVVCPGGGYVRLAVHKEGYNIANWLTSLGYTVFVLQYRVPNNKDGAWQDIQRAIKLIRFNAKKYDIDPDKIGSMGFSAGAHLIARAGMADSTQRYPAQDASDAVSSKPNCMIIIYPGYLSDGPNRSLTPELKATVTTVPTFIFQTMDDGSAPSSFALGLALRDAKADVELHMLPKGGHGYGMYPGNVAAETWPGLLAGWLKSHF